MVLDEKVSRSVNGLFHLIMICINTHKLQKTERRYGLCRICVGREKSHHMQQHVVDTLRHLEPFSHLSPPATSSSSLSSQSGSRVCLNRKLNPRHGGRGLRAQRTNGRKLRIFAGCWFSWLALECLCAMVRSYVSKPFLCGLLKSRARGRVKAKTLCI